MPMAPTANPRATLAASAHFPLLSKNIEIFFSFLTGQDLVAKPIHAPTYLPTELTHEIC
jgi:hypothetical protein